MALKTISTRNSEAVLYRTENLERFLKEINSEEKLNSKEERELLFLAQQGDKVARDKIIKANLKFVVSCAKEYQKRKFELMDLISAGTDGLIEAIEKFDLEKEVRFISYAVWRIKAKIIVFIRENISLIQLPLNQQNEISKIIKIKDEMDNKELYDYSYSQIIDLREDINYELSYVRDAIDCNQELSSLDQPEIGNEDFCLAQTIQGDYNTAEIDMFREERKVILKAVLKKLPKIQQDVLSLSFGLKDGISRTNEDIALCLDKTPESIRQIRTKGIEILGKSKLLQEIA